MLTAFYPFTPVEGLRMTDIDDDGNFVVVQHVSGKKEDRPRRLKLYRRKDGSHFFTWRMPAGEIVRINTEEFIVLR